MPRSAFPTLPVESYTVAWICALEIELTASRFLIDEPHRLQLPFHARQQYVGGTINGHNVIMACLPAESPGTSYAAATLAATLERFPNIQFALMVGIGGGVWSEKNDIRLGDVVIGYPDKDIPHGGVIQYDYGKAAEGFKPMGYLSPPQPKVLTTLQIVRSTPPAQSDFLSYVEDFDEYTNADGKAVFGRPQIDNYYSNGKVLDRTARSRSTPRTHYGLIASGNQVIKNAGTRDRLVKERGDIICFEMEAAGLANQISCLAIRGICDYCDAHKNNEWHSYAAAVAAAWAKEFLANVSTSETATATRYDVDGAVLRYLSRQPEATQQHKAEPKQQSMALSKRRAKDELTSRSVIDEAQRRQIVKRMSSYDPMVVLKRIARGRTHGTSEWLMKDHTFQEWNANHDSSPSVLAVVGKVGSGKTYAMSYLIEQLLCNSPTTLTVHCFIQKSTTLTALAILSSFTRQMIEHLAPAGVCPPSVIDNIEDAFGLPNRTADLAQLVDTLLFPLLELVGSMTICIDGIDQLDDEQQELLLAQLALMIRQHESRLLISCQDEDILRFNRSVIYLGEMISEDINTFIDEQLHSLALPDRILAKDQHRLRIRAYLVGAANGMFLWVALMLDILSSCETIAQVDEVLCSNLTELNQVYLCCLRRRDKEDRLLVSPYLMSWMSEIKEPLSVTIWKEVLATDGRGEHHPDRQPTLASIRRSGVGLISIDHDDGIMTFVHDSVETLICNICSRPKTLLKSRQCDELYRHWLGSQRTERQILDFFTKHIDTYTKGTLARRETSYDLPVLGWIPLPVTKVLCLKQPKPRPRKPAATRVRSRARTKFLSYAIRNWPRLCAACDIVDSLHMFAMDLNRTESIWPWTDRVPLTTSSLLQGMFAWAITQKHPCLFDLAFTHRELPREVVEHIIDGNELLFPIHMAASMGDVYIFGQVWNTTKRRRQCSRTRRTALHYAAEHGHTDIISLILASTNKRLWSDSIDPAKILNCIDFAGYNALDVAIKNGHGHVVELLTSIHGIEVNNNESGKTALIAAIEIRNVQSLTSLLKVSTLDLRKDGRDPFVYACKIGHAASIEALLMHKSVKHDGTDVSGRSPLSWAVTHDIGKTIEQLIDQLPQRCWLSDYFGRSPLSYAAEHGRTVAIKALLASNVAVDDDGYHPRIQAIGRSPLSWAVEDQSGAALAILCHSHDPNQADMFMVTPLFYAIWNANVKGIEVLLNVKGISHVMITPRERIPLDSLSLAVDLTIEGDTGASEYRERRMDIVKALLATAGINANLTAALGKTPLLHALMYGDSEIVGCLLGSSAVDVHAQDLEGHGAYWHALQNPAAPEIMSALKERLGTTVRDGTGRNADDWEIWFVNPDNQLRAEQDKGVKPKLARRPRRPVWPPMQNRGFRG